MNQELRILITGAGGMLAEALVVELNSKKKYKIIPLSSSQLDITNRDAINLALQSIKPEIVINAAAYTNVDGAETEKELSYNVNALGPKYLADSCREFNAKLVHFSTDHVFDGVAKTPRQEEDPTNPCNYYGETKLDGERFALQNPNSLVLRIQWLYGDRRDRFTSLRGKESFGAFSDQLGAPTSASRVSEAVEKLLCKEVAGLFHFAYDDYASWAEVFSFAKNLLHLETKIIPKLTSEVKLSAKRPLYSVMCNSKLKVALGVNQIGSWKKDLELFLSNKKSML